MIALVGLAGCHFDVEHDAEHVIDRRVLLVGGLQAAIAGVGRHRRIRIRQADLLVFARLLAVPLGLELCRFGRDRSSIRLVSLILRQHRINVLHAQALPCNVGADQRGIDMHHFALGDPSSHAAPYRAGKHLPEQIGAPTLTNARQ